MKTADRIALFTAGFHGWLAVVRDRGYITFDVAGGGDRYVQFLARDGGRILGEACSGQWQEPEQPLAPDAVAALAELGFTGGGPERNYSRDNLPWSASELAVLTDQLMSAAWNLGDDWAPTVHRINPNDVPAQVAVDHVVMSSIEFWSWIAGDGRPAEVAPEEATS